MDARGVRGGETNYRVTRGGSWHDTPDVCRSAARLRVTAGEGDEMTGFRVALDAEAIQGAAQS